MITTCRSVPSFDTTNPYKGDTVNLDIFTDDEAYAAKVRGDIYETVLWYFQFKEKLPDAKTSQYFGIMDIDIDRDDGMDEESYKLKISGYLPYLENKLSAMNYHQYKIYLSGSKGYHVYIFDTKCWVIPENVETDIHNFWIEEQVRRLYPLLYEDLDMNIYHINKGIRNPLYPHPKTKRASRLLVDKNAPSCFWEWFMDVIHTQKPISSAYQNSPRQKHFSSTLNRTPPDPLRHLYCNGSILDQLKSLFKNATVYKKDGSLYLVKGKYCPLKGDDHKSQGKCYINVYDDYAVVKCHHTNCYAKSLKIQKKKRPLTDFSDLLTKLKEKKIISEKIERIRTIDPKNQKHVLPSDIEWALQDGCGIISAPMGAGKTTSVIRWIEETRKKRADERAAQGKQPKQFKVLLLVTRITQANNFCAKYPGMKNYLDVEGSIANNESSVLCINSLVRAIPQERFNVPHFDLLILDEMESLIESLIGAILSQGKSKQCNIWQLFKCLIMGSKRVLMMDGIFTERTAMYLERLKYLPMCSLVQHEGQPDYRDYINFRSSERFDEEFASDIQAGKKVVIVSNSKSILYTYSGKASLYGKSQLIITGDSTNAEKLTASDPNEEWSKDVLGFNTAVGPGASYDEIHFDVMYMICSPLSCTPYSLYQMINRIRTLREKTVKMLILYNEYKLYPSKEELKKTKSSNIVKMHQKQTEFGFPLSFYQKIGADYIKLDINSIDNKVLRNLIRKEQLVLYYEDDHFVDTLVDYEYQKLRFNDTEYYSKVLFNIIRRNGGTIKGFVDYEGASEETKKTLKDSARVVRKEGKKNYMELALSSDNIMTGKIPQIIDPNFRAMMNMKVQFNDIDTQLRWCSLRRAITKSEVSLYETELEAVNTHRKAINNTLIYSTGLLESLIGICNILGFKINTATGVIDGNGTYANFTGQHKKIDDYIRIADKQLFNSTKRELPLKKLRENRMPRDTDTFKNVEMLFASFGITIILHSKEKHRKLQVGKSKERFFDKRYEVCLFTQHVRMAFSGLAYDTGLVHENPFVILQDKYKKI